MGATLAGANLKELQQLSEYGISVGVAFQLRDDVRKFIDNGESLEFAMENAASSLKEQWLLFDIQNKRNVNRIFPMMEWE